MSGSTEVSRFSHTGLTEQNEIFEGFEAATADGDSCLEAIAKMPLPERVGILPHALQAVRQGLLIYAASQKLVDDLKLASGGQWRPSERPVLLSCRTSARLPRVLDSRPLGRSHTIEAAAPRLRFRGARR